MVATLIALSLVAPQEQPLCSPAEVAPAYRECVQRLAEAPDEYAPYICFYERTHEGPPSWDESLRTLRRCVSDESGWSLLIRGHIALWRDDGLKDLQQARTLYSRAIQSFQTPNRNPIGEIIARVNLRDLCWDQLRDRDCADEQVELALETAADSQVPDAIGWACVLETEHLIDKGLLGDAYDVARKCRDVVAASGAPRLQRFFRTYYGIALELLGRTGEAQDVYREKIEIARRQGDRHRLPLPMYNLLRLRLADLEWLPENSDERLSQLVSLGEEALRIAKETDYSRINSIRSWLGGMLTSMGGAHAQRGIELLREGMRDARRRGEYDTEYYCFWHLVGHHLRQGDKQKARQLVKDNRDVAQRRIHYSHRFWEARMLYALTFEGLEKAVSILDEIERLRALQKDPRARIRLMTNWTGPYYWLAGRLLREWQRNGDPRLLEWTFDMTERMRARVLLESLQGSRAAKALEEEQKPLVGRIEEINAELKRSASEEERKRLLEERESLEETRMRMRFAAILQAQPERPGFAQLSEIEESLRPNQAVISFLLGLRTDPYGQDAGGAWALVITSRGTMAAEIADRSWVHEHLPFLEGLVERRDQSAGLVTGRFYDRLLRPALEKLPAGIDELILAPDGDLHRLPYPLLAKDADAAALGHQYRLSFIPSVSLWRNWVDRPRREAASAATAMALADPVLSEQRIRDFRMDLPWEPQPLPYARREGQAVRRLMGETSRLMMGEEASERFLEQAAPEDFAVLHFAAHAVVDNRSPQRSAIMLAPGASEEDGILAAREIVDMDLNDNLVVLSACQSASGTLMQGEGVVGLARAFFQAGARVVVGSLWPLRDDDAAFFFESFYSELGEGHTVSSALQASQRAAAREGLPPQAWAGIVALGDASLAPFPDGVAPRTRIFPGWLIALAVLFAAASGAAFFLRRRRKAARRMG